MKLRFSRCLFALPVIAACAAPQVPTTAPRPIAVQASPAEYAHYLNSGTGQIAGQVFLTTRGGDVKLGAGRVVTLDPATTYAKEWFRRFGANLESFDSLPSDSLFGKARRETTTNAEGRFQFTGLPEGEYIVRSTVTWEVPGAALQGGVVAAVTSAGAGGQPELVLNHVVRPEFAAALGVEIVSDQQLAQRSHRVLGPVTTTYCQVGTGDPAPDEGQTKDVLLAKAVQQGADAVAHVNCKRHGISFRPNCMARIECSGDGIVWTAAS